MTELTMKDLIEEKASQDFLNPNDFGEEDVDHINVSFASKSFLGTFLNPTFNSGLRYPLLGGFRSMNNLLAWIRSDGSIKGLRKLSSKELAKLPRDFTDGHFTNFRAVVLLATLMKIKERPDVAKSIKALPKDIKVLSYTTPRETNTRMVTTFAYYTVPIIQEVINSIQEDREPNWDEFLDVKGLRVNGFLETVVGFEFLEEGRWGTKILLSLGDPKDRYDHHTSHDAYIATYTSMDKLITAFSDSVSKLKDGDVRLVTIARGGLC